MKIKFNNGPSFTDKPTEIRFRNGEINLFENDSPITNLSGIKLWKSRKKNKVYFCNLCGTPEFAMYDARGVSFQTHLKIVNGKATKYQDLNSDMKINADQFFS